MLVRLSRAPVVSICFDPRPRHRRRQRTVPGERHALRQPREGGPVAMGNRRRVGAWWRPDGPPASPHRARPRAGVLLAGEDISGDLAERYGYVNRALPDAELDHFVGRVSRRIARFDKRSIADIKRLVDIPSLPPNSEIAAEWTRSWPRRTARKPSRTSSACWRWACRLSPTSRSATVLHGA